MITDFNSIIEEMRLHGMPAPKSRINFSVPDSEIVLKNAFKYFVSLENKELAWNKGYDEVSEWLANNEGKGLMLMGNSGLGKSLLGRYIIPAILLKYCRKVVNVYDVKEMNEKIDEILTKQAISLDDIGTEEIVNNFGNKRMAFAEIIDAVEKHSKLIIITTNLDKKAIDDKYGFRVYDRLIATTKRIKLEGESLRR
jgi:DNA replication protein DnaC